MKTNLIKFMFLITFILVFFPTFVIYIVPNTNINLVYAYIFSILLYLILIIFKYGYFTLFLKRILSLKILKVLLLFIVFSIFTTFIHIVLGYYEPKVLYYYAIRFARFYCSCMLIYTLPTLGLFLGIKPIKIIKIFYTCIWIILLIGFIQFFSHLYNITIIDNIFDFFTNARQNLYLYEKNGEELRDRVYSVFSEPAYFGFFICLIMPFVFKLKSLKIKLLKNKYFNFIICKTFLILLLCDLCFTVSPVFIIFGLVEFVVLMIYNNLKHIKHHILKYMFISFIIVFIGLMVYYTHLDKFSSSNFIRRICSVYEIFKDYNNFVIIERSLATRIYSIYLQIQVGLKNFFIGCGHYNSAIYTNKFMNPNQVNLIMSAENYVQYSLHPYLWTANLSIIFTTFAETGIIGILLYVLFVFSNIKFILNNSSKVNNYYKFFMEACLQSIVILLIISFYTIDFISIIIWLIYGFVLQFAYMIKYKNN